MYNIKIVDQEAGKGKKKGKEWDKVMGIFALPEARIKALVRFEGSTWVKLITVGILYKCASSLSTRWARLPRKIELKKKGR